MFTVHFFLIVTLKKHFLMQTRFMGISHGSSRLHVTVWSIFGNGRCLGSEPKALHAGQGCSHQLPLSLLAASCSLAGNLRLKNSDWADYCWKYTNSLHSGYKNRKPPLVCIYAMIGSQSNWISTVNHVNDYDNPTMW